MKRWIHAAFVVLAAGGPGAYAAAPITGTAKVYSDLCYSNETGDTGGMSITIVDLRGAARKGPGSNAVYVLFQEDEGVPREFSLDYLSDDEIKMLDRGPLEFTTQSTDPSIADWDIRGTISEKAIVLTKGGGITEGEGDVSGLPEQL